MKEESISFDFTKQKQVYSLLQSFIHSIIIRYIVNVFLVVGLTNNFLVSLGKSQRLAIQEDKKNV